METWAIVAIVLGTNIITGLVTWFITKTQLKHSDKQLKEQLDALREVDSKERRWEVRSQPLLKLRAELARMASKQQMLVDIAYELDTEIEMHKWSKDNMKEQMQQDLQQAVNDWKTYEESGDFRQALCMQYDDSVATKVEDILDGYQSLYLRIKKFRNVWASPNVQLQKAKDFLSEILSDIVEAQYKVIDAQSLINKVLEEL